MHVFGFILRNVVCKCISTCNLKFSVNQTDNEQVFLTNNMVATPANAFTCALCLGHITAYLLFTLDPPAIFLFTIRVIRDLHNPINYNVHIFLSSIKMYLMW